MLWQGRGCMEQYINYTVALYNYKSACLLTYLHIAIAFAQISRYRTTVLARTIPDDHRVDTHNSA